MNETTTTAAFAKALAAAGLAEVLSARARGASLEPLRAAVEAADLMLVGGLGDALRRAEVGDRVHITVRDTHDGRAVVPPPVALEERGLSYLRAVAMARIFGAPGAAVVVDWTDCGMELAQIALAFGANELAGPIVSKRGLPIADDATKKVKGEGLVSKALLKKRELVDLVRRTGRTPIVDGEVAPPPEPEPTEHEEMAP